MCSKALERLQRVALKAAGSSLRSRGRRLSRHGATCRSNDAPSTLNKSNHGLTNLGGALATQELRVEKSESSEMRKMVRKLPFMSGLLSTSFLPSFLPLFLEMN